MVPSSILSAHAGYVQCARESTIAVAEHKKPSCWGIRFSTPPAEGSGRNWWGNHDISVFAMTAEKAIAVIRDEYPTAEVHQVNRKSSGEVLFDKEILNDLIG